MSATRELEARELNTLEKASTTWAAQVESKVVKRFNSYFLLVYEL